LQQQKENFVPHLLPGIADTVASTTTIGSTAG
jgi:hypothetical protein